MQGKGVVLYKKIKEEIKEQIESGRLKENDKIPSIVELSKKYNVSTITIRLAISELVKEGYLETRGSKGTYVKLKKPDNKLIALFFYEDTHNQFIGPIYSGIEQVLSIEGYHTVFLKTDGNQEKEAKYLQEILEREPEGIIISPASSSVDSPSVYFLRQLKEKNIPIVFIDIKIENFECDYVETDNLQAGYEATKYLIEKGHKKIGIILARDVNTIRERFSGYLQCLKDNSIEFNRIYVKQHTNQKYYEETGYICGLELLNLKDPPTAIFCTCDGIAVGLYKACHEMNLKIPEDISVIGFDNLKFTEYMIPPLTTVSQEKKKMGKYAAKILMSRIKGSDGPVHKILLPHKIIERGSVAKPKIK
ncbi:GntR family transcriptional regulator [bacterium]|nr:GntR family transcriptional regulator [bacterium]